MKLKDDQDPAVAIISYRKQQLASQSGYIDKLYRMLYQESNDDEEVFLVQSSRKI